MEMMDSKMSIKKIVEESELFVRHVVEQIEEVAVEMDDSV
jgi:hypothetical protein